MRGQLVVKLVAIVLAAVVILNFLLMIFRRISPLTFWIVVALCALCAYKGVPYLRKRVS